MDGQAIIGIASVLGVGIGLAVYQSRQSKKNQALGARIDAALRGKGARTLAELTEDLGMPGFMNRGKLSVALGEMRQRNAIEIIDAPPGTPQLKKVDLIRYKLPDGLPNP